MVMILQVVLNLLNEPRDFDIGICTRVALDQFRIARGASKGIVAELVMFALCNL